MLKDKQHNISTEYERLKSLFCSIDETKIELVDELLKKAAYLKVELDNLQRDIDRNGVIQVSNKGNTRVNLAYKTYLQTVGIYQSIIKTLNSIFGSTVDDGDDEFDEFLKQAGGGNV